ncbi:MAG: hypothetical protein HOM11_09505 [Methylococcales bacterium]|jgi:hypothetical protein|nr:hypothetical protein [Methylococcales bacterium]MBT7445146.1 hypothetical protein [Methylococcales bacterium]
MTDVHPFLALFRGDFYGMLRWEQLDTLWGVMRQDAQKHWHIYHVGDAPPEGPIDHPKLLEFITHIDELLHKEHQEEYCGVVYVDNPKDPAFVKVFDPNNLGVSCGFSDNPPLPGWILSLQTPIDLPEAIKPAKNRQRWWQKIFD